MVQASRTPEILADAAHRIFLKPSREFSGRFLIDDLPRRQGVHFDFTPYRVDPSVPLMPDFFVPASSKRAAAGREGRGPEAGPPSPV